MSVFSLPNVLVDAEYPCTSRKLTAKINLFEAWEAIFIDSNLFFQINRSNARLLRLTVAPGGPGDDDTCMYVYIYIYCIYIVYIYIYLLYIYILYIYIYTHVCIHIHTYTYTCIHTLVCIYIYIYMSTLLLYFYKSVYHIKYKCKSSTSYRRARRLSGGNDSTMIRITIILLLIRILFIIFMMV